MTFEERSLFEPDLIVVCYPCGIGRFFYLLSGGTLRDHRLMSVMPCGISSVAHSTLLISDHQFQSAHISVPAFICWVASDSAKTQAVG
jgi:hypothetical protein